MTDAADGAGSPSAPGQGDAGVAEDAPRLSVTAQYVKDFSFENPNAPQSLAPPKEQPQIDVNVDVEANPWPPTTTRSRSASRSRRATSRPRCS